MNDRPIPVPAMTPRREARIALVGGAGAIGARTAEVLEALGCVPVVLDTPRALETTGFIDELEHHVIDLEDETTVDRAFAALAADDDHLDGLVNLAGFTRGHDPVEDLSPATWDAIQNVNLRGAFLVARAALPMLHRGTAASAVLLSSVLGIETMPGYAAYGAAKAGLLSLTRVLARENAPTVRVNALAPGAVDTPFLSGGTGRPSEPRRLDPESYGHMVPLGRIARVDDIVGPILFLLSPASGYITGTTILVDGGLVPR